MNYKLDLWKCSRIQKNQRRFLELINHNQTVLMNIKNRRLILIFAWVTAKYQHKKPMGQADQWHKKANTLQYIHPLSVYAKEKLMLDSVGWMGLYYFFFFLLAIGCSCIRRSQWCSTYRILSNGNHGFTVRRVRAPSLKTFCVLQIKRLLNGAKHDRPPANQDCI